MGMFVHITRRKFWAIKGRRRKFWSRKSADITAEEWRSCVESDPELRMPGAHGPDFADWVVSSQQDTHWLAWIDGEIFAQRPDAALIAKMHAIARRLDAVVQDDDGTIYNETHAA